MITFVDKNGEIRHDRRTPGGNFDNDYLSLSIENPYKIIEVHGDIEAEKYPCGAVLIGMSPGSKMSVSLPEKDCMLCFTENTTAETYSLGIFTFSIYIKI